MPAYTSVAIAIVVAICAGLLVLTEKPTLPSQEDTTLEMQQTKGYVPNTLQAPRLAGSLLQTASKVVRVPGITTLFAAQMYRDNKIVDVRKLAASLTDNPTFFPLVAPKQEDSTVVDLVAFRDETPSLDASAFRYWTVNDYTSRYTSKELTPLQVAKAILHYLNSEDHNNVFIAKHDEEVLREAELSTKRYATNQPKGALDGIFVPIKDEMNVKGFPVTGGTSFLGDLNGISEEDDKVVALLRDQGAIILGKSNMHEYGIGITGHNNNHGFPRNPHNTSHYTGGSSSGAAAVVSSGLVPFAIGSDGGGSVRIPSSFCGVVGIKPTFQRVEHVTPPCPTVASPGVLANSVRDAALAYAVISEATEEMELASFTLSKPAPSLRDLEASDLTGLRIGYFEDYALDASDRVQENVKSAMQKLEKKGAKIIPVKLEYLNIIRSAHMLTILSELATATDAHYLSHFHELGPETSTLLTFGRGFSAVDMISAQKVRAFAIRQLRDIYRYVDVMITPTTAMTAPKVKEDAAILGELDAVQTSIIMRFAVYANFAGTPAMSVPTGIDDDGLPLAIQVEAEHWKEDVMMRVGRALEKEYEGTMPKPQVHYDIEAQVKSQGK